MIVVAVESVAGKQIDHESWALEVVIEMMDRLSLVSDDDALHTVPWKELGLVEISSVKQVTVTKIKTKMNGIS